MSYVSRNEPAFAAGDPGLEWQGPLCPECGERHVTAACRVCRDERE